MHIMQNATFQHHKHYLIIAGADEEITYKLLTSLCDTVRSLGASSFGEPGESQTLHTLLNSSIFMVILVLLCLTFEKNIYHVWPPDLSFH